MYHVSAQAGVDERMINVHYIYIYVCVSRKFGNFYAANFFLNQFTYIRDLSEK